MEKITRSTQRDSLGLRAADMMGEDIWNSYEFSWLDAEGKPKIAMLRIRIPCRSKFTVESKSLKLYLNSFYQTMFPGHEELRDTLIGDLSDVLDEPPTVEILDWKLANHEFADNQSICLDDISIEVKDYRRDSEILKTERHRSDALSESIITNLFRCLCPLTGQPDWASIRIDYEGIPIDKGSLLRYLISYREHRAFHESTIELIFSDILEVLEPVKLSVFGYFLRRGGIDINPFRSNFQERAPYERLIRQ